MAKSKVKCNNCNKSFKKENSQIKISKTHYCTRSCAAKKNNSLPKRTRKQRSCKHCNKDITELPYARVVCEKCKVDKPYKLKSQILAEKRTVAELKTMSEGKSRPWTDIVRSFSRSWFPSAGKQCLNCGYDKHVELCHIRPISDFPDDTIITDINNLDNIIYLCPNCHWELDNGVLILKEVL